MDRFGMAVCSLFLTIIMFHLQMLMSVVLLVCLYEGNIIGICAYSMLFVGFCVLTVIMFVDFIDDLR